jgi:hypothetical protein
MAELRSDIEDFVRRDLTLLGKTKPVPYDGLGRAGCDHRP